MKNIRSHWKIILLKDVSPKHPCSMGFGSSKHTCLIISFSFLLVKPVIVTVRVPAAPLRFQIPACVLGKQLGPCTYMRDSLEVPVSWLQLGSALAIAAN